MPSLYRGNLAAAVAMATALMLPGAVMAALPAPGPTLPNTAANCNLYYVAQAGDGCYKAWSAGKITEDQFFLYNPDVSRDCATNFWPGNAYCIGIDPTMTTTAKPTTTTSKPTTTTTSKTTSTSTSSRVIESNTSLYSTRFPVTSWKITTPTSGNTFPPERTQAGQPSYCIDWHYVGVGDSCPQIAHRYGMVIDDLLDWNPELLDDCSGLQLGWWLCVRIQPQTSLTLTFNPPDGTVQIPDATSYVPTTVVPNPSFTPTPSHGAMPSNCKSYYFAQAGDRCDNVLAANTLLTRDQFFAWNPVLNSNCDGLWSGVYYCVWAGGDSALPAPPTVTTKPSAAAPSIVSNCASWYLATSGDTCQLIVDMFGRFSLASFVSWNPSVGTTTCAGIKDDVYYCVAVPGTPTTRTTTIPSATSPADPPTQSGIAEDCTSLWQVST